MHLSVSYPNSLSQAIGITSDRVEQLSGWVTVISDKEPSEEPEYKRPKPKNSTLFLCEKFVITYRVFASSGNDSSFSLCVSL